METKLTIENLHEEIERIEKEREILINEITALQGKSCDLGKDVCEFLAQYITENYNGKIFKFEYPLQFSDANYFELQVSEKLHVFESFNFDGYVIMSTQGISRLIYKDRDVFSDAQCSKVDSKKIEFKYVDGGIEFVNCSIADDDEYNQFLEKYNKDMAIQDREGNHVTSNAKCVIFVDGEEIPSRVMRYDAENKTFGCIPLSIIGELGSSNHMQWVMADKILIKED